MTPREVDELSQEEYGAMLDYAIKEGREAERARRRARKR